jgi:formylglycine-generating enzyme required for sulfatase activity
VAEYLDFRLHIGNAVDDAFPVSVTPASGPAVTGSMRLPFDPAALEIALLKVERAVGDSREVQHGTRDVDDVDLTSVESFGGQLFGALFTEQLKEAFRTQRDVATLEGKGLRIRLSIEPASLACLPWEFLYDPSVGDFVCLSSFSPVVRYLDFEHPLALLKVKTPLRMLAMIASPTDLPTLDVANEKQRIMEATKFLQDNGLLQIDWLEKGATYDALQKTLRRKDVDYHIFHFVGHGGFSKIDDEGLLAFERENGTSHEISSLDIGRLLADEKSLRLVVLNSCLGAKGSATNALSSTAAALVRRGVPSVVAMQYKISDRAAIAFARALYEAIADGLPIDYAVSEARKMVSVAVRKSVEWATPVLYTRTPDGVLFALEGEKTSDARKRSHEFVPFPDGPPLPEPVKIVKLVDLDEHLPKPTPIPDPPTPPNPPTAHRSRWAVAAAVVVIGGVAAAYAISGNSSRREQAQADSAAVARRSDSIAAAAAVQRSTDSIAAAAAGASRTVRGPQPRMVTIPGDTFTMGSDAFSTTKPMRAVTVATFELGEREVTVGEFKGFVDANPTWTSTTKGCMSDERTQVQHADWSWKAPGFPQDSLHPVVCVSVRDALAYIAWLNRTSATGGYRLASEAEWEYAARARTATPQYWADRNETCDYAVSAERPPLCVLQGVSKGTQPPQERKANTFGVYDMLGNASEWTQDCWNRTYAGAPVTSVSWRSGTCSHQVVRGGAWIHSLREVNAAFRSYWDVNQASNLTGFRVARSVPAAP